MLLSMTGFGDARDQNERVAVTVRVRSVNHRYFRLTVRAPEPYSLLEPRIEKLVRQRVARGTVTITLDVTRLVGPSPYRLDPGVIRGYWDELGRLARQLGAARPCDLTPLLALPGSVAESEEEVDCEQDWPLIEKVLVASLEKLHDFRAREGESMLQELRRQCEILRQHLEDVAQRAPEVVTAYRDRLLRRVNELLSGTDVRAEPDDLLREVSVFAERCDIGEELTRLGSHLDQFAAFLESDRSEGRRLDFLGQEMFREINTIGAKANDVKIAHSVVEMKAAAERIREILQNVE